MLIRSLRTARLSAIVLSACAGTMCSAAVIYVDDDASGTNDGTSWDNAFTKIRAALAVAVAGDEVRVAQGTYAPANAGGSRTASIVVPEGVTLLGGYAGVGTGNPDERDLELYLTILTGDLNGDDGLDFANTTDNSLHVVTANGVTSATVISGVVITGGNADGVNPSPATQGVGGGVLLGNHTEIQIIDCVIELNQARYVGGGVFGDNSSPLLRRCEVVGNRVTDLDGNAGGVVLGKNSRVQSCLFEDNTSTDTGGALAGSGVDIVDSEFINNTADHAGGAVTGNQLYVRQSYFQGNVATYGGGLRVSNSRFLDCTFEQNSANRGAAISNNSATSTLALDNCTFSLNNGENGTVFNNGTMRAKFVQFNLNYTGIDGFDGGAVANRGTATMFNCTFYGNLSSLAGGAISNDDGDLTVVNCLFSGNRSNTLGGALINDGGTMRVKDCTLIGNVAELVNGSPGGAIRSRGGGVTRLHNSILWANTAEGDESERAQVFRETGNITIANCIIQGWTGTILSGVNVFADNPSFVDDDGPDDVFGTLDDDARLLPGSPAINTGDNSLIPPNTLDLDDSGDTSKPTPIDLDGEPRIQEEIVDMGAYEWLPVT